MNNMIWFQGVVEDRNDPLQLGRVRIRCVGYHSEDKQQLPTEDLPWATPIQPITSAAMSGIGTTPVGPVEGSWVVGFFRDGMHAEHPVFFGTIGGLETGVLPPAGVGFQDPNGNYPLTEGPNVQATIQIRSLAEKVVSHWRHGLKTLTACWRQTHLPPLSSIPLENRRQDMPHNIRSTMSSLLRVVTLKNLMILRVRKECIVTTAQEPLKKSVLMVREL